MSKNKKQYLEAFVLGVVLISGFVIAKTEVFPYKPLNLIYMVGMSIASPFKMDEYRNTVQWVEDRWDKRGLTKGKRTADELILYSQANSFDVVVMDNDSSVKHKWSIPYSKVWGDFQAHLSTTTHVDDDFFYIRDFHMYDNGDLLVMMNIAGATPWGAGVVKVDKDSNVLWSWIGNTNNDLELKPNGNILITNQEVRIRDLTGVVEKAEGAYLSAQMVELDPQGNTIDTVSVADAIFRSDYIDMVAFYKIEQGDFLHFNSIEYVEKDHPTVSWLKEGNQLWSIRNMNVIAVYDPKVKKIIHAFRGGFIMQHDIDYLPETATLMLYDNRGALGAGRHTRILEIDPVDLKTVWSYEGTKAEPFHSDFWGVQQKLSNGNVMTIEAEQGRMIEVTREGDIVWEYFLSDRKVLDDKSHVTTITNFEVVQSDRLLWLQ